MQAAINRRTSNANEAIDETDSPVEGLEDGTLTIPKINNGYVKGLTFTLIAFAVEFSQTNSHFRNRCLAENNRYHASHVAQRRIDHRSLRNSICPCLAASRMWESKHQKICRLRFEHSTRFAKCLRSKPSDDRTSLHRLLEFVRGITQATAEAAARGGLSEESLYGQLLQRLDCRSQCRFRGLSRSRREFIDSSRDSGISSIPSRTRAGTRLSTSRWTTQWASGANSWELLPIAEQNLHGSLQVGAAIAVSTVVRVHDQPSASSSSRAMGRIGSATIRQCLRCGSPRSLRATSANLRIFVVATRSWQQIPGGSPQEHRFEGHQHEKWQNIDASDTRTGSTSGDHLNSFRYVSVYLYLPCWLFHLWIRGVDSFIFFFCNFSPEILFKFDFCTEVCSRDCLWVWSALIWD